MGAQANFLDQPLRKNEDKLDPIASENVEKGWSQLDNKGVCERWKIIR